MQWPILILLLLAVAALIYFYSLGKRSARMSAPAMVAGDLPACSARPNCVSSNADANSSHYIAPLSLGENSPPDWPKIKQAIESGGGEVQEATSSYLHATYTSRIFGYIDDLQLLHDPANAVVQIRSASRVGHSDMGVNRKRVDQLIGILR